MSLSRLVHACILRACQTKPYDGSFFLSSWREKLNVGTILLYGVDNEIGGALCSIFCLQFFPISRVVKLRSEVLSFKQKKKESLGTAWEHFNTLINTGPDLAIQDPILLQHFYMGLDRKTSKLFNTTSGGSFLHVSANTGRSILTKILENIPKEVEEKPLEEES